MVRKAIALKARCCCIEKALVRDPTKTELLMIRHAPSLDRGRLAGRNDVEADCSDARALAACCCAIGRIDRVVVSPARRCAETAAALWPTLEAPEFDPRLWEQNFGAWEGLLYTDLPALGRLSPRDLALHRPPGGESFVDLCARTQPALASLAQRPGRIAIVAHAGTVRAALALALGLEAPALAFKIAPLSVTRFHVTNGADWAIDAVNWTANSTAPGGRVA